jgi:hypothetical protein
MGSMLDISNALTLFCVFPCNSTTTTLRVALIDGGINKIFSLPLALAPQTGHLISNEIVIWRCVGREY